MNTENKLLNAVDVLTVKTVTKATQTNINGISCVSEIEHEPLIAQLRSAIASNLGGSAGGKSPNERVPLDADALQKYEQIEDAILHRYEEFIDTPPGLYPEQSLRAWYIEFSNRYRDGTITDQRYFDEVSTLENWARIIRDKLSPPSALELAGSECPECGFAWYDTVLNTARRTEDDIKDHPPTDDDWREPPEGMKRTAKADQWNWVDKERRPALTVTYRPDNMGGLTESFAKCGNCNHVWMGSHGIRALAYEIESKDPEQAAEELSG